MAGEALSGLLNPTLTEFILRVKYYKLQGTFMFIMFNYVAKSYIMFLRLLFKMVGYWINM